MKPYFTQTVDVYLPNDGLMDRWLNLQHCGKELIPFTDKVSKEHKEAAYNLHRGRRIKLTFKINKDGDWKLITPNNI